MTVMLHAGDLSFSVVTPSLDQAPFLERAITSVLDQVPPPLEYWVNDAGSTDGSDAIIERYADRLTGWRSTPDAGQSAAINEGWRRARGDVLAWINSDDYLLPGAFGAVSRAFAANPDVDLVYGRMELVDDGGRVIGQFGEPWRRRTLILSRSVVPQPAAFVRRRAVEALGYLDEDLQYVMDFELWLRIASRSRPLYLQRTLAGATVHRATKTTRGRTRMADERQRVRARYARGPERILVRLQPVASAVYHRLPGVVAVTIDRFRPRRARADLPPAATR